MEDADVDRIIVKIDNYMKTINTPELALDILFRAGIVDEHGSFTKPYQNLDTHATPIEDKK